MKYCNNCGASMADDAGFCGQCGKTAGNTVNSPNPRGPVPSGFVQPNTMPINPMMSNTMPTNAPSNSSSMPWVAIVAGIVLVGAIGGSYFFFSGMQKTVNSFIPGANQSTAPNNVVSTNTAEPTTPAAPNQTNPVTSAGQNSQVTVPVQPNQAVVTATQGNANALNEFRAYAQSKERLNTQIIELAVQVNGRINQNGNLKNAQDLKGQAQLLMNDIMQQSSQLSGKTYPPEFQKAKTLLIRLFDLEATRVQSLYNGLLEGANGQNYSSSFSVGTSAAYKFDEENGKFIQENSLLDSMVKP